MEFNNITFSNLTILPPPPIYIFSLIPSSINEGSSGTFNVITYNEVPNGTTLYWTINNSTTSSADFSASSGSFTVNNRIGSFTVSPTADAVTEGAETFTVSIRTVSTSGTIVATSSSVTINDTSLTPTYTFSSIPSSINEGSSGTFNVSTTNVNSGTRLYWVIATNSGDFTTTSGSFTVSGTYSSATGSFSVSPRADALLEGPETFTVDLKTVSTSGTTVATSSEVTINDTSIPTTPSTIDYLIVAGGAAGGAHYNAGGGGAGGLTEATGVAITVGTTYTVTVGGGGAAVSINDTQGTNGTDSSLNIGGTTTTTGGGGGGSFSSGYRGKAGGSGGGTSGYTNNTAYRGLGTSGQGNDGGVGNYYGGGGGGGRGSAGGNAPNSKDGGTGGSGYQWLDGNFYAGGGGGAAYSPDNVGIQGAGGSSIGGDGATFSVNAKNGAANTGSGGGGAGGYNTNLTGYTTSGKGGGGVVVIRYPSSYGNPASSSVSATISGGYKYFYFTSSGSIRW